MNPNRGCAISAFRHGWILLFGGLGPFWSTSAVLLLQYLGHIHLPFQIIFLSGNAALNAPSPSRTRAWAWWSTGPGVQSLHSHASHLPPWTYEATVPMCAFHLWPFFDSFERPAYCLIFTLSSWVQTCDEFYIFILKICFLNMPRFAPAYLVE